MIVEVGWGVGHCGERRVVRWKVAGVGAVGLAPTAAGWAGYVLWGWRGFFLGLLRLAWGVV